MFTASFLITAVIQIAVLGLVFWLLWWLVNYIAPPEPFRKVANVILAVVAVVILISFLMGLSGSPLATGFR
jgi:hypothetical protein